MFKIGLTGGIASGKSTISDLFHERHGVPVIDADLVAREVVAPGSATLGLIVERFGVSVLTSEGELNRRELRELIFAGNHRRAQLEAILHPVIKKEMLRQAAQLKASYCLFAIPLLVEANQQDLVDRVLVIDASEEAQIERLMRRDDVSEQQARSILAAQLDRDTRLAAADDIITNAGSIEDLVKQVDRLHQGYLHLSVKKRD